MQVYLYEQLSNVTVFADPLPLPSARNFSAADFDGDGDVDIMIETPAVSRALHPEQVDPLTPSHMASSHAFGLEGP